MKLSTAEISLSGALKGDIFVQTQSAEVVVQLTLRRKLKFSNIISGKSTLTFIEVLLVLRNLLINYGVNVLVEGDHVVFVEWSDKRYNLIENNDHENWLWAEDFGQLIKKLEDSQ